MVIAFVGCHPVVALLVVCIPWPAGLTPLTAWLNKYQVALAKVPPGVGVGVTVVGGLVGVGVAVTGSLVGVGVAVAGGGVGVGVTVTGGLVGVGVDVAPFSTPKIFSS